MAESSRGFWISENEEYKKFLEKYGVKIERRICSYAVLEHEGVKRDELQFMLGIGSVTKDKSLVTCEECLEWLHA